MHPAIFFFCLLLLRFVVFVTVERKFIAHRFDFRSAIFGDLLTTIVFAFVIAPAAFYVGDHIGIEPPAPRGIDGIPPFARILLYVVITDFGHYWMHRLMHMPLFWRIHQWHHSPTHMSWCAGNRATFFDAAVVHLPYVIALPLLGTVTPAMAVFLTLLYVLINDWMHLNVRWRLAWLEPFLLTPRYHHIHHSSNPAHFSKNLSALLPVWDRLFGTYFDPELSPTHLEFGINERKPAALLVLGL